MTSGVRRSSQQSARSHGSGLATDPPPRPASRLKRLSDVAARRLSASRSFLSSPSRSGSPRREQAQNKLPRASARNSISSRASGSGSGSGSVRAPSSMETSAASSTTSHHAPVLRRKAGGLPVVVVSQRDYLASLVSLFSDRHARDHYSSLLNTPASTNTAITEPSRGSYEYDLRSVAIYRFSKSRRLYVGRPTMVSPPPEALLEFEMETLPLLERDLQGICGHLGQQGIRITYELRMSGHAGPTAETVSLAPTVWILYRSSSSAGTAVSVAELHQAAAEMFYLKRGPEIHEGGGRIEWSSDQRLINTEPEETSSIKLFDGGKLSIHIENRLEKSSICGAQCCMTIDEGPNQVQSLCRIGGLLKINGKYVLAVTTAHAMLDNCGIFRDSFNEPSETQSPKGKGVDRDSISAEARRVSHWQDVTRDAAVDFLGISMNSRGEMAINRAKPESATDFALLRLRKVPRGIRNKYTPPHSEEAVTITSTASESASSMDEGPVHILCGVSDVVDARLVWGSARFIVRGRNFRVRRLQTLRPLSAGASGSWVVRGEVLYGVIIAVYENEPFALMMTAERLFASIMGSAFSIRSVELWDGETPSNSQSHHRKDVSETSKKTAALGPRPRSAQRSETREEPVAASSSKDQNGSDNPKRPNTTSESRGEPVVPSPPRSTDDFDTHERSKIRSRGTQTFVLSDRIRPRTADSGTQTGKPPYTRKHDPRSPSQEPAVVPHSLGRAGSKAKKLQKPRPPSMGGTAPGAAPAGNRRAGEQGRRRSSSASESYTTPPQSAADGRYGNTTEITADAPRGAHGDGDSDGGESLRGRGGRGAYHARRHYPPRRRNSLQHAFDRTFRRSSSRGPEHGAERIYGRRPSTGGDGRPSMSQRKRRSFAADSNRTASAGA